MSLRNGDERRFSERREETGTLDISGFGLHLITRGRDVVLVALFLSVVAFLVWGGWLHHTQMQATNQRLEQQIVEMVYVLSLPQDKRDALNLAIPSSLRQKVRRQHEQDSTQ